MVAGLEGDIGSRALRRDPPRFSICNCHLLGMQSTYSVVPPLCYDPPVLNQNTTYHWVGHYSPTASPIQAQSMLHEFLVRPHLQHLESPLTHHFLYWQDSSRKPVLSTT